MKWATRANIHIDRAACAWLIRRDLDPDAQFVFLTDPTDIPTDATAFDLRGVELGHHHGAASKPSCAATTSPTPSSGASPKSSTKPTSTTNATTPPKPQASTSPSAAYP